MRVKPNRFHGLKKIKVRQTWNKHNLYNLSRLQSQRTSSATFFQQKWSAKSLSRSYHGEYVREKQWQKMFRPFNPAVVPLDAGKLAEFDGSEQAEGRGSGKDVNPKEKQYQQQRIPYMGMLYGPMERRLDQAIFRALFASSARQARQFVVHGGVTVNGEKMIYPGYLLNPGDMFQVDPDRVMFATGEKKELVTQRTRRALRAEKQRKAQWEAARQKKRVEQQAAWEAKQAELLKQADEQQPEKAKVQLEETEDQPEAEGQSKEDLLAEKKRDRKEMNKKQKAAQDHIKAIIKQGKDTLTANKKKELRAMIGEINELHKTAKDPSAFESAIEPIISQFKGTPQNQSKFQTQRRTQDKEINGSKTLDSHPSASLPRQQESGNGDYQTVAEREEISRVLAAIEELRDNPIDRSKPYATPWKPRPWMAPFVFIPRYLEVNQKICAAVYLRHPVARPGLAEVPSPFAIETSQLAFTWYLRRR